MLAFHNDPAVKQKYLDRVQAHIKADNLMRGCGWSNGKGCAIGCTLEAYDHQRYEIELGIPEWLARVEDTLFEGMTEEKSRTWPEKFLAAIKPGANLETCKGPFLVVVLTSALETFDHVQFPDVKTALDRCIELWQRGGTPQEFEAATWAAWAARAAWAAEWAAEVAAGAVARAVAWVAEVAAGAGARAAKYDYFADELIKILEAA